MLAEMMSDVYHTSKGSRGESGNFPLPTFHFCFTLNIFVGKTLNLDSKLPPWTRGEYLALKSQGLHFSIMKNATQNPQKRACLVKSQAITVSNKPVINYREESVCLFNNL